ncbi:MAG: hypothetical protein IPL61_10625 [Myxococcales bacterium]|nr:hypothetical protein [Myxococcales bacterium]
MPARSPLHLVLSLIAAAGLASMVACAAGAEGTGGDGDPIDARRIDGPNNPNPDAATADARLIDAPGQPIDAPVSLPDAPVGLPDGGIPGTCTTNADCTVAGECCFVIACTPGVPLPPPINCLPN